MKICQVIPHYVPATRFGGPQRVAHPLGKALVRAGHSVVVCTTNLADRTANLDVPVDEPVIVDGATVYYEPVLLSRYWGFSPSLWRRVAREVQQADVVLVHAHYQFANWAGARLARKAGKPYVFFAHSSLHRQGIALNSRLLKQIYLRVMERKNLERTLFIAFNAPEEKAYSMYSQQGVVVPSGIDPDDFRNMPPAGSFRQRYPQLRGKIVFLFLGRLDVSQKGLDLLLPAFARLRQEQPNVHLLLVGPDEGGGLQQIQGLVQKYGLDDAVTLTGMIVGRDKLAALQDADVFVLPSRYEGLSIALLEALYMGLPILTSDQVGLHREIEQVGAGLIVPADSDSLYAGLRGMMDERTRLEMRGPGTRMILQKYTWDAIASDLVEKIQVRMGKGL